MKHIKKIAIVSIILNLLFVVAALYFVEQKGGLGYLESKFFKRSAAESLVNAPYIQRSSLFELLPVDNNDIIFLGDSITQRNEWAELFNNAEIKNRGIDSDTTTNVLKRLNEVVSSKPEKIFIMVGINDLQLSVKEADILENYTQILSTIKENSPDTEVYVQSVLPINETLNPALLMTNEQVVSLNNKLEQEVAGFDYKYLNLYDSYLDKDNQLNTELTKDGIHLVGEGYTLWKERIEQYVNQ